VHDPIQPALVSAAVPLNFTQLCGGYGRTGFYPYINIKPAGMTCLSNGSLVVGVSCMNYGDDPQFNRQHNLGGFWAQSDDGGATWYAATAVGAFPGRLAAPVPVQGSPDGFTYVFFPGSFNDAAYWDNNDGVFLARAPAGAAFLDPGQLLFFAGVNASNAPQWTNDSSQAQPVVQFGRMVGENTVFFNSHIQRWVMANFGFLDDAGNPRPWHTQPFMMPHRTQLLFLEAPQPWGPWALWHRDDNSSSAPGLYTPSFPNAYHQPVQADGTSSMLMAFSCLDGAPTCRYTLNWQPVSFSVAS
jgi:hypothetical protein